MKKKRLIQKISSFFFAGCLLAIPWMPAAVGVDASNSVGSPYTPMQPASGEPPVAADDSGVGFMTDEDTAFTTGRVLANDRDPESDPLTVTGFDTSGTLGLVTFNDEVAGSLDTNVFGAPNGYVTINFGGSEDSAQSVAIQPDGKIVVAGSANNGSNFDFALARYQPDGRLDTDFGSGGAVITDFDDDNDYGTAVMIQTDGKIVVAGSAWIGSIGYDFALVRYDSDGSLDSTFGSGGKVTTDFGDQHDNGVAIAIHDGKILIAGIIFNGDDSDFALARYNSDGSPDTTFGSGGKVTTDFGDNDGGYSVAIQPDDKIVIGGNLFSGSNWDIAMARYNSDGSLDTTFGSGGKVVTNLGADEFGYAVAIQSDEKIVVAGYVTAGIQHENFVVVRYDSNGGLDATFSSDGVATTNFGDYDEGYAVVIQPDGKIVLAGSTGSLSGNDRDFALACYTSNGSLDSDFGTGGKVISDFGGDDSARAIAIQPDGKLVVAGGLNLARYRGTPGDFEYFPNGQFDGLAAGAVVTDTFTYVVSDGTLTDTATVSITIRGVNDAPLVFAGEDQSVNEGERVSLTGVYTDPDGVYADPDSFWNFGDGVTTSNVLTPTHAYAADGPYTVTLVITDDLGAVGADSLLVIVSNIAPALLSPLADQSILVGTVLTLTAAFTDPGLLDTHAAAITWGDGLSQTLGLAAGISSFEVTHRYVITDVYTVTIVLNDDDGGVDTVSFDVTVSGYILWLPVCTKAAMLQTSQNMRRAAWK